VDGFSGWSPRPPLGKPLSPGLVAAIHRDVPKGSIVFSDTDTSYRIAAAAPVYVAASRTEHVANTKANHPYARRADVQEFFRTGRLAIPRRYGAQWLVVNRARSTLKLPLRPVYAD